MNRKKAKAQKRELEFARLFIAKFGMFEDYQEWVKENRGTPVVNPLFEFVSEQAQQLTGARVSIDQANQTITTLQATHKEREGQLMRIVENLTSMVATQREEISTLKKRLQAPEALPSTH